MNHKIEYTTSLRIDLGASYVLEIFTIRLGAQPVGCPGFVNRAYISDNGGGGMDIISVECPNGSTFASITAEARKVIALGVKRDEAMKRLLDAVINHDDEK